MALFRRHRYNNVVRRLFRFFLNAAAALSLALAIAMVSLWVRSKSFQDVVFRYTRDAETRTYWCIGAFSKHGACQFYSYRRTFVTKEGFDNIDTFLGVPRPCHEGFNYKEFPAYGPDRGSFWFRNGFQSQST